MTAAEAAYNAWRTVLGGLLHGNVIPPWDDLPEMNRGSEREAWEHAAEAARLVSSDDAEAP